MQCVRLHERRGDRSRPPRRALCGIRIHLPSVGSRSVRGHRQLNCGSREGGGRVLTRFRPQGGGGKLLFATGREVTALPRIMVKMVLQMRFKECFDAMCSSRPLGKWSSRGCAASLPMKRRSGAERPVSSSRGRQFATKQPPNERVVDWRKVTGTCPVFFVTALA